MDPVRAAYASQKPWMGTKGNWSVSPKPKTSLKKEHESLKLTNAIIKEVLIKTFKRGLGQRQKSAGTWGHSWGFQEGNSKWYTGW